MTKCPEEFLKTSNDQTWIPCPKCGKKELIQVRKALWTCQNCNQEIIADEKDMRTEEWKLMKNLKKEEVRKHLNPDIEESGKK